MAKTKVISTRLSENQIQALDAIAKENEVTTSAALSLVLDVVRFDPNRPLRLRVLEDKTKNEKET